MNDRHMSWLDKVTPINVQEEKAKFWADNSYNPQFLYEPYEKTEADDDESLTKYGVPKQPYLDLAREILQKSFFGRNEADLLMMEGPRIPQDEVTKRFKIFLDMHKLADRFEIIWSSSFISRATISEDKIKLRTNSVFYRDELIGLMYHEVGTHALRRINYEHQEWYKKKKEYGMTHSYLRTEEGLATLNQLLPRQFAGAYTTAIRYLAVDFARTHSFSQLWQFLSPYVGDLETRWMITIRQYRGVKDTAQHGGSTKDLVYFEGFVHVWQWLAKHNFDPTTLYLGKISYEDVDTALLHSDSAQLVLPSFFTLDREAYAQKMQTIGEENFLREFPELK